jgi:hypothetical protein
MGDLYKVVQEADEKVATSKYSKIPHTYCVPVSFQADKCCCFFHQRAQFGFCLKASPWNLNVGFAVSLTASVLGRIFSVKKAVTG